MAGPTNKPKDSNWSNIIGAINAPLGFFVLSLLIVESFLASIVIAANLTNQEKITGMCYGVIMFVLVIVLVFLLDWFKPQNLTFDKNAHLIDRGKIPYGSDSENVNPKNLYAPHDKENES